MDAPTVSISEDKGVYSHENSKYELPDDDQRASLGDFWKVLRVRPTPTGVRSSWATLEYLPNNTYSYYKVKKTLKQVHGYAIKPSRYWNETCALSVQDHILYSLAEFCPGMPREADIVASNQYLGMHSYRMLENVSKYDDVGKRTEPDIEATITALVTFGTIPNREQRALEDLKKKVQEVTNAYFFWTKNWHFLAAYRLLTMHLFRSNHIKKVLMELLPKPPASAESSSQSGETMDYISQSAYGRGHGGRGGRGY